MQNPTTSLPPQKEPFSFFLSKTLLTVLKRMKNQFFSFLRFSVFQIWAFKMTKFFNHLAKNKMRNILKLIFEILCFFCAIFSFCVMVDFVFYLLSAFRTYMNSKNIFVRGLSPPKPSFRGQLHPHTPLQGLRPQGPDRFGLNPPSQLIIRYHWLAVLDQVRRWNRVDETLVDERGRWNGGGGRGLIACRRSLENSPIPHINKCYDDT